MKCIAVSQRLDLVPGRDEYRDALDERLAPLLWSLGFLPVPLCSGIAGPATTWQGGDNGDDAEQKLAAYLATLAPDGILLSGGNDIGTVPTRDRLEHAALTHAGQHNLPVLGICRGLDMINHHQGGRLVPVEGHVAVRHRLLLPKGTDFKFALSRTVNSYHNYAVPPDALGTDLEPLALAEDGTVEALRHRRHPWLGIMWHPERDVTVDPADLALIRDHLQGNSGGAP